jgi:hypothetical protein
MAPAVTHLAAIALCTAHCGYPSFLLPLLPLIAILVNIHVAYILLSQPCEAKTPLRRQLQQSTTHCAVSVFTCAYFWAVAMVLARIMHYAF